MPSRLSLVRPSQISYVAMEVFLYIHDPTTWNRKGNDVGSQCRSEIFFHSEQR